MMRKDLSSRRSWGVPRGVALEQRRELAPNGLGLGDAIDRFGPERTEGVHHAPDDRRAADALR